MPEFTPWPDVLSRAYGIVTAAPAGITLRELFDALVEENHLRDTRSQYAGLSRETSKARKEGRFPPLLPPPYGGWTSAARRTWEPPRANRLTDQQAEWLGPALVEWGDANADAVTKTREAMRSVGWSARGHTAVLVAVAQQARDELAAEAIGASPSLRAVYYRLVALFGMAKTLRSYQLLVSACSTARERGVMDRRAFVDSKLSDMTTPGDFSVGDALESALASVPRPDDAFVDAGLIVGVVCEARGMSPALAGASRRRLGFPIPVWATAGQVSIPFAAAAEDALDQWADDREAHVFVITDYDPAGLIIANNVQRRVNGVTVHRIGVWPDQAERFGAPTAEGIEDLLNRPDADDDDTRTAQERAAVWEAAVAEHGAVKVQAEALGPSAWAEIVHERLDDLLTDRSADAINTAVLARALRDRRAEFAPADRLMDALRVAFNDVADDADPVQSLANRLGLSL